MRIEELAIELRRRRKERKLSQEELAKALGVGRNFIKAVEAGKTNIQLARYLHLLDFFGIQLESNMSAQGHD